jgi:hypothetical protein
VRRYRHFLTLEVTNRHGWLRRESCIPSLPANLCGFVPSLFRF